MIIRPQRLATWGVGLLLALAAWACSAADVITGRPLREGFGVGVKFAQGQPEQDLETLAHLGVSWVRDTVRWAVMEPKAGQYQPFPAAFERRLAYYRSKDIGVVFYLAYANHEAHPATRDRPLAPVDPEAFGRYAAHVARLLKASGVRHVIEVWNEPHNFTLREMVGGHWNGKPPSPWVGHYVDMVRHAVKAVKQVDARTRVITCEDVWVNHYRFLEAGLPAQLDGFGLHPYTNHDAPGPERTSMHPHSEWARPFRLVDPDRSFASAVNRLRAHGEDKLGQRPEIWITEWGWRIGSPSPGGPIDAARQAAFLPRAFIVAEAAGVEALLWFSLQDSVDGPYGLLGPKGVRRPAYTAYRTLAHELGDYALAARLSDPGRRTEGVQAFLFTQGETHKVALWSADNRPRQIRPPADWDVGRVVNAWGEVLVPRKGRDGQTYPVGAAPIYLEINGKRPVRWSDRAVQ